MSKRAILLSFLVFSGGCASSGSDAGNAGSSASAGTLGSAGAVAGGRSGSAGTEGQVGGRGGAGGVADMSDAGGLPGSSGSAGSGGTKGPGGATGAGGSGGNAQAGASGAGAAGSAGTAGSGGSASGHGSAAKFVCTPGASYGSPLTGMSTVTTIAAAGADHFVFTEGSIWIASLATLFFSDNASTPTERIFKLTPPSTTPALFVGNSGSNGLAVDNSDRLIAADQRNQRIVRFDPMNGQIVGTPISTGGAKPNDVIVRSDNNIYFTDPDSGFYRISPSGTVSAAMKLNASNRPNGIELSLDENTLYVGDVGNRTIAKYTLASDGTVMTASGVNVVSQTMHDSVDGMCVDCAGNIYAGTSGGVEVYSADGKYVGTVPTGSTSNCTFGGADRKTLYVTSRTVLKSVTLGVPGLPD